MTDAVFDFKSIARKLNRQEQKAEFEAKNPKEEPAYLWPYGVAAVPYGGSSDAAEYAFYSGQQWGDSDPVNAPLKSMAHPEWPYAGTPFEWTKFVNVKI